MSSNSENSAMAAGLEKVSIHFSPKEGQCQRCLVSQLCLLHMLRGYVQNPPTWLQQYMTWEHTDVQALFRKGRRTKDQIANICWIIKKAKEFQKNIYFCFIDYAKAFDCVDHNKLEISERDGNARPPDLPLEKSVCRSGSNSLNWIWNNRLVPNGERSISRLYTVTRLI